MTTNPPSIANSTTTESVNAGSDTTKSEQTDKGISFKWLFVVLGSISLSLIAFYYFNFGYRLEMGFGNQADFGAFGDFLGGVLNPILGFATVGLLIWSLKMQRDELSLSRQELALTRLELKETKEETALSRQAMQEQVEHLKNDSSLKELRELLSMQMNFIDASLNYSLEIELPLTCEIKLFTLDEILNKDIPWSTIEYLSYSENTNLVLEKFNLLEQQVVQYSMLTREYFEITNKPTYTMPYLTNALTMARRIQEIRPSNHIDSVIESIGDSIRTC
jgi:hypothetical protein